MAYKQELWDEAKKEVPTGRGRNLYGKRNGAEPEKPDKEYPKQEGNVESSGKRLDS